MIKGVGHLAFTVKDMEKSLDFYCNALGFKKAFDLKDDNGNPWIEYVKIKDGQFIELFYGKSAAPEIPKGAAVYSHLCLEVDDIYSLVEDIRGKGVHIDVEPKQGKDSNIQAWIKDPDGNRIELMQMSPDSPQNRA